jgi:hypothetical protein
MYRDFESMGIYNASRRDVALELLHKVTQWGKSN